MKIAIEKIVDYEIEVDQYYSNDIFSFRLAIPTLYEQRLQLYKEQHLNKNTQVAMAIEKECTLKGYDQIGNIENLVELNLAHVYRAAKYFTNGQTVISLLKTAKGYEVGIHKNMKIFAYYFYSKPILNQLSLADLDVKKYEVLEKAEAEIMKVLSMVEVTRIPLKGSSNTSSLVIRKVYPRTYFFHFNTQTIIRETDYNGYWIDKLTKEMIELCKPLEVGCCLNCKHFRFSGMSHSSSGGVTGYCFLVREKLDVVTVNESTTKIWNWCSKFEVKEN
ncbi:MAG: hypothetical protein AB8G15_21970 [Saprospiraceae bacterium]